MVSKYENVRICRQIISRKNGSAKLDVREVHEYIMQHYSHIVMPINSYSKYCLIPKRRESLNMSVGAKARLVSVQWQQNSPNGKDTNKTKYRDNKPCLSGQIQVTHMCLSWTGHPYVWNLNPSADIVIISLFLMIFRSIFELSLAINGFLSRSCCWTGAFGISRYIDKLQSSFTSLAAGKCGWNLNE